MNIGEVQVKMDNKELPSKCDYCHESNDALFPKPNRMVINHQLILSHQVRTLYICIDCFNAEIDVLKDETE